MLSFETGAAFWPSYQHSVDEAPFQDVAPCILAAKRAGDSGEERSVLWNWCDERLLQRCSETAGTRLVRVLLQGFYTAELLLCVKPLPEEKGNSAEMAGMMGSTGEPRDKEIGVLWTRMTNEMANSGVETWNRDE